MFLKTLFTNFIPLQVNYWHVPTLYVILCKRKITRFVFEKHVFYNYKHQLR